MKETMHWSAAFICFHETKLWVLSCYNNKTHSYTHMFISLNGQFSDIVSRPGCHRDIYTQTQGWKVHPPQWRPGPGASDLLLCVTEEQWGALSLMVTSSGMDVACWEKTRPQFSHCPDENSACHHNLVEDKMCYGRHQSITPETSLPLVPLHWELCVVLFLHS